jgi:hypothetical protein
MNPLESRPSPAGPVHAACARSSDAVPPVFDERLASRAAPKYGGPPVMRAGRLAIFVGLIAGLAWAIRRLFRR